MLAVGIICVVKKSREEKARQIAMEEEAKRKEEQEKYEKAEKRRQAYAEKKERDKKTCPQCDYYPIKIFTKTIQKNIVTRNVRHVFLKEKYGFNYDSYFPDVVNVALEPQSGIEIIRQEVHACPKCKYRKEFKPTKTYKWSGPDEIRDVYPAHIR